MIQIQSSISQTSSQIECTIPEETSQSLPRKLCDFSNSPAFQSRFPKQDRALDKPPILSLCFAEDPESPWYSYFSLDDKPITTQSSPASAATASTCRTTPSLRGLWITKPIDREFVQEKEKERATATKSNVENNCPQRGQEGEGKCFVQLIMWAYINGQLDHTELKVHSSP